RQTRESRYSLSQNRLMNKTARPVSSPTTTPVEGGRAEAAGSRGRASEGVADAALLVAVGKGMEWETESEGCQPTSCGPGRPVVWRPLLSERSGNSYLGNRKGQVGPSFLIPDELIPDPAWMGSGSHRRGPPYIWPRHNCCPSFICNRHAEWPRPAPRKGGEGFPQPVYTPEIPKKQEKTSHLP